MTEGQHPSVGTVAQERRTRVRCPADSITRGEFANFTRKLDERLGNQDALLGKFNTAMFAQDAGNENGQPGLMVTARNIDQHITAVCNIAKWTWKSLAALIAVGAPMAAMGKALGWW